MLFFGMLRSSSFLMDSSCMAPLTPAVMMITGFVFHPLVFMSLIRRSYLECFSVMAVVLLGTPLRGSLKVPHKPFGEGGLP